MLTRLLAMLRPKKTINIRYLGCGAGQGKFFLQKSGNIWNTLVFAPPGAGMSFIGADNVYERSIEEGYDFACPDSAWDRDAELIRILKALFEGDLGSDVDACCSLLRELGHAKSAELLKTLDLVESKSIARIDGGVWSVFALAGLFERFRCAAEKLSIGSGLPRQQSIPQAKPRLAAL